VQWTGSGLRAERELRREVGRVQGGFKARKAAAVAYGAFQRSVILLEGVDAAQVEAKYANGMLEVRVPAPRAATPRMIEVKAA
jgi:HSP20 family molecular chaperone IbpA